MSLAKIIYNTHIISDVFEFVKNHPNGVSSAIIANKILKFTKLSKNVNSTLVEALLAEDPRFVYRNDRWFVEDSQPKMDFAMWEKEYVAVDIEATGPAPPDNRVMEIGAVRIRNGKIIETFDELINPECKIPIYISRMTGIDKNMVANKPTSAEALPRFLNFLGDAIFVAHNASFDSRFLRSESLFVLNRTFTNPVLCTLNLAKAAFPGLDSYGLETVSKYLGLVIPRRHRALDDAVACAQIFLKVVEKLGSENKLDFTMLVELDRFNRQKKSAKNAEKNRKPESK